MKHKLALTAFCLLAAISLTMKVSDSLGKSVDIIKIPHIAGVNIISLPSARSQNDIDGFYLKSEPFAFNGAKLPAKFKGNNIKLLVDTITAKMQLLAKGEFETTEEHEQRIAQSRRSPLLGNISIDSKIAFLFDKPKVEYNADSQSMRVKIEARYPLCKPKSGQTFGLRGYYVNGDYVFNTFNDYLLSSVCGDGRTQYFEILSENSKSADSSLVTHYRLSFPVISQEGTVFVVETKMNARQAQAVKNNIRPLIIGKFAKASIERETIFIEREKLILANRYIPIAISDLWIYNYETGDIYAKATIDNLKIVKVETISGISASPQFNIGNFSIIAPSDSKFAGTGNNSVRVLQNPPTSNVTQTESVNTDGNELSGKQGQPASPVLHTYEIKSLAEIASDQAGFIGKRLNVRAKIRLSSSYVFGYNGSDDTHHAFYIRDTNASPLYGFVYLARSERSNALRKNIIGAGGEVEGLFTIEIRRDRYKKGSSALIAELLDFELKPAR